jgi:hypothetical protein
MLTNNLLKRTPAVLRALLQECPEELVHSRYAEGSFSPLDVVGHLIHGEKTDWLVRVRHILEHGDSQPFAPFDRFAMREASVGRSMDSLLDEFADLRAKNLRDLAEMDLDLSMRGLHPELGPVTMRQLLATWAAHDLGHLAQIAKALAAYWRDDVGPWKAYLTIVR